MNRSARNLMRSMLLAGVLVTAGCAGVEETVDTAETEPAELPPPVTAVPVTPTTLDQQVWLESDDPQLAANKRKAYDFFRRIIRARHVEEADQYMAEDYIQHNPLANTGRQGFVDFFTARGEPLEVEDTLPDLVAIQAEGDYVTLSFVREYDDPQRPGETYTTTWFDMLRVNDEGLFIEHWDSQTK